MSALSARLAAIVDALPLSPGMRVLEIGGAPGAMAREMCARLGPTGHVLVIDRSAKGVALIERTCADEIRDGVMRVRHVAAEDLTLLPGDAPFDLAVAIRVGALDGRHPRAGQRARERIRSALRPGGRLVIDGGSPLRDVPLD